MNKNLFKLAGLVISAMLLGACSQMATYENEDLTNSLEKADQSGFKLNPYGLSSGINAREYEDADCSIDCIVPESEDYFVKTDTKTGSSGPNTKQVIYRAYNTETHFVVEVDYNITSGNSNAKSDITITIDGDEELFEEIAKGNTVTHSILLPEGWIACDDIQFTILQEALGNPISWNESYSLFAVCSDDCDEESFSYVATNDNLSVTFKYDAATALKGAVVEFTFPQIIGFPLNGEGKFLAPDGKLYTVNNPINQTVFTWTGDIGCTNATATTFQFNFSPDCGAGNANDGQARIWADTKINGVSVKNSATPNIDYVKCSIPA